MNPADNAEPQHARVAGPMLLASVLVLGGCAAGPNYHTPKPDTPPRFAVSSSPADGTPASANEQELAILVAKAR